MILVTFKFLIFFFELLNLRASMKIADDAFNSNWTSGDRKFQKSIQFIMMRAQKAQVLRGLKYLEANLETFVWVRIKNNLKLLDFFNI